MDIKAYVGLPPDLTANWARLLFLAPFPTFYHRNSKQERLSFLRTYVDTCKIYLSGLADGNIGLPNLGLST